LYIYDGWQCIEERNAASPSTVLRQYVYGSQYIDEVVCKIEDPGGTPAKLFYLHDCNYNVVALTNTSAAVQERYNYEPYGGLTIAEADYDVISATTQNNSLTFQGQRYDAESGLYYFRNRYLSPVLGRFLQRDPMGYVDGMNLYTFIRNQPTTAVDPLGLFSFDIGVGAGYYLGGGLAVFVCCDENNYRWISLCYKKCVGPMIGASFAAHAVDIPPSKCPKGYEGYFVEGDVPVCRPGGRIR